MIFRQIVGVLARRVVCRVAVGAQVRAGNRFGLMKFGSRMDVFLPLSAELLVAVGDRVRGGETIVARLNCSEERMVGSDDASRRDMEKKR